jgi:pyruvate formate lyase activating enzyme
MTGGISRRDFMRKCGGCIAFCAGLNALTWMGNPSQSRGEGLVKGFMGRKLSPYFTPLDGKMIRCELCPKHCEVEKGGRGFCRVRENVDGQYYSLVYGNPCSVHIDPIEKKPFFHVLPGTSSFSIATAGCNFDCKFCQNWEISQAKPNDTFNYDLPPAQVVEQALRYRCRSIASTYVEPTIFCEYMIDTGKIAKQRNLLKVMHSNGFINEAPLNDLCEHLDAACIDLKGFSEAYYREMTGGSLDPVLSTLKRLRDLHVHTEIVNLMVPGKNDDVNQVRALCRWVKNELGADVPLHFTRFYPLYKLKSIEPTPVPTLESARKIALEEGLHFVYIGNVPGHTGENTYCPKCNTLLIERIGYRTQLSQLKDGKCMQCGRSIPGIWERG